MKLVTQQGNISKSVAISEIALEKTINQIKLNYIGSEILPGKYEIFRYKSKDKLFVIYKNNRTLRSKNSWYEIRALTSLSKHTGENYYHSKIMNLENNFETEIDGLSRSSEKVMVEVKRAQITQDWIDFYSKKTIKLNMKECVVVGPSYDDNVFVPNNITPYVFSVDTKIIDNYYKEKYELPDLFEPFIQRRHIRILLQNGKWQGIKRIISKTAKHSYTSKFRTVFSNVINQNKTPIRVYYSLAPMVNPVAEYFGNGLPFSMTIAGLDVDADHKNHYYGKLGYCTQCKKEAEIKSNKLSEKLDTMGYKYLRLHSGSKGFHFYLLDEDKRILELPFKDFRQIISELKDDDSKQLVDNINFIDRDGGIDSHRIFKLPNSIDATTGVFVTEKFKQISFADKLYKLK